MEGTNKYSIHTEMVVIQSDGLAGQLIHKYITIRHDQGRLDTIGKPRFYA
jgi:hypothetical protein